MKQILLFVMAAFLLANCGGRVGNPTPIEKSFDDRLSCAHLEGELNNNAKRLAELEKEREDKKANNIGLLLVAPPHMDFSNVQGEEAAAINKRNDRIRSLMSKKGC